MTRQTDPAPPAKEGAPTLDVQTPIPRTLIQFWDTPQLPEDIRPKVESWAEKSGLTQRVFCKETAADFIAETYGPDYIACFEKCALPAMKSDFFRILAVYHYGGWYVDCSIECLQSPVSLLTDPAHHMAYYRRWHGGVNNGFFAAVSQCAHLGKIIDSVVHNVTHEIGKTVWEVTGPKSWNAVFPKETSFPDVREIAHTEIAAKYVTFHHDLNHKKGGKHWSEAQKVSGVFAR